MSSASARETSFTIRFVPATTATRKSDVFQAVMGNNNPKRIKGVAMQALKRAGVDNPQRVFGAHVRFVVTKQTKVRVPDPDSEPADSDPVDSWTPPKHAVKVMTDSGAVWQWSKWLTSDRASTRDIERAHAIEIVVPKDDADSTIMTALKKIVVETLTFAVRPSKAMPVVPTVFVPGERGYPYSVGGSDTGVDIWYNEGNSGYMMAGTGRDAAAAARRVACRMRTWADERDSGPVTEKTKVEKEEDDHNPVNFLARYRDNFAASLASSARGH